MGEVAVQVIKWLVRFGFVMAAAGLFIGLFAIGSSIILQGVNGGALSDVIGLVNMWMPFNLSVMMFWLFTAASAYFLYRFALLALVWVHRLVG